MNHGAQLESHTHGRPTAGHGLSTPDRGRGRGARVTTLREMEKEHAENLKKARDRRGSRRQRSRRSSNREHGRPSREALRDEAVGGAVAAILSDRGAVSALRCQGCERLKSSPVFRSFLSRVALRACVALRRAHVVCAQVAENSDVLRARLLGSVQYPLVRRPTRRSDTRQLRAFARLPDARRVTFAKKVVVCSSHTLESLSTRARARWRNGEQHRHPSLSARPIAAAAAAVTARRRGLCRACWLAGFLKRARTTRRDVVHLLRVHDERRLILFLDL